MNVFRLNLNMILSKKAVSGFIRCYVLKISVQSIDRAGSVFKFLNNKIAANILGLKGKKMSIYAQQYWNRVMKKKVSTECRF